MACGLSINTASLWAEGSALHKSGWFKDLSRTSQQSTQRIFSKDIPDRAILSAKKYDTDPPPRLRNSGPPSPFAAINYRDPLLTSTPKIRINLPFSSSVPIPRLQAELSHPQIYQEMPLDQPQPPSTRPVEDVAKDNKVVLSNLVSVPPTKSKIIPPIPNPIIPVTTRKSEACIDFLRHGYCRNGIRCRYIHIISHPKPSRPNTERGKTADQDLPGASSTVSDSLPEPKVAPMTDEQDIPATNNDAVIEPLSSDGTLQNTNAYIVKLPLKRHTQWKRDRKNLYWTSIKKARRAAKLECVLGHVEVGFGPFDLFDTPCDGATPVVKLPSTRRRTKNSYRMKGRTLSRPATEQLGLGGTKSRLDNEHGQISDSSVDTLSDLFSNSSFASSQSSIEDHCNNNRSVHQEDVLKPLEIIVPPMGGQSSNGSRSNKYLENAPEKPPGLEHIRPRNISGKGSPAQTSHRELTPEWKRFPEGFHSHSNLAQQKKQSANLIVTISDHSKVEFGPGFEVLEFVTGFESRWIHIKNLPPDVKTKTLNRLLEPFGHVTELRHLEGSSTARAQFPDLSTAVQAATLLNGTLAFNRTISVSISATHSRIAKCTVQDATVMLSWEPAGRVGYGGYSTLSEATAAIAAASDEPLRGCFVVASLHQGLPAISAFTVRFHGLPPDAVAEDVKRFGDTEGVMLEQPNYVNPDLLPKIIRPLLQEFGENTFEKVPPSSKERLVRAWVTFSSPQIATSAAEYLNSRPQSIFRRCKLRAKHIKAISYLISQDGFFKIRSDLRCLQDSCSWRYGQGTCLKFGGRPGFPYRISAAGESLNDLRRLKTEIEAILYGEVIKVDGKPVWDRFFGQFFGKAYLGNLERVHPSTSIRTITGRRVIVVFGSFAGRKIVRERILNKFAELKRQQVRTIPLSGRAIGLFMSADLISLQKRLGPENVVLDLLNRNLRIRGNDQAFELAREVVRHAREGQGKLRQAESECPICFGEVTSPVTLQCGHSWCKACLSGYLVAATDSKLFPLTCLGSDASCPELIPITTAQEILPAADFDSLINTSFTTYVHSRPDQFYYCPTPDCQQIYRAATQSTVLQCPACLIRICPVCHVEYHDGLECTVRTGEVGEEKFREWSKEHDVKNCPGCKVPIERTEGCNHLTCTRCHTHICWVCLKTFPKGEGVYDHMRQEHGGIGL